jgi:hypothetical protein
MANRFGQAYGFTALTAILGGEHETGLSHDAALRREMALLNRAGESPFADLPTTHLARWVILPEAPFESIPAKVDHFQSKYLLFTSNFDGGTDPDDVALRRYLEAMRVSIPDVLMRVYRHCVGFPGVGDAARFATYFKSAQVTTTFLFGAYANATVDQVLRALLAQRRIGDFIAEHQEARSSPAELQAAFVALRASLASAPTPRAGIFL